MNKVENNTALFFRCRDVHYVQHVVIVTYCFSL